MHDFNILDAVLKVDKAVLMEIATWIFWYDALPGFHDSRSPT
jgi:hypothetical protein